MVKLYVSSGVNSLRLVSEEHEVLLDLVDLVGEIGALLDAGEGASVVLVLAAFSHDNLLWKLGVVAAGIPLEHVAWGASWLLNLDIVVGDAVVGDGVSAGGGDVSWSLILASVSSVVGGGNGGKSGDDGKFHL